MPLGVVVLEYVPLYFLFPLIIQNVARFLRFLLAVCSITSVMRAPLAKLAFVIIITLFHGLPCRNAVSIMGSD